MRERNKSENDRETKLEDQEQIVNKYLDALLSEVTEYSETDTEAEKIQETAEIVTITQPAVVVPEKVRQTELEEQMQAAVEEIDREDGRAAPDWAQEPFQCLIFRVGDITIATPLLALDNIVKWETELTPMPFQPDWHLGVLQNRDDKVVVVDTAKLLMLDDSQDSAVTRKTGSHILIIGDHRFGLACDSLAKPMFLHKEDVHWSIKHEDRPWMAGTIKEKLTILLDIDELLQIIRHE
jgi:purine-binding chemotaxis protein CheW